MKRYERRRHSGGHDGGPCDARIVSHCCGSLQLIYCYLFILSFSWNLFSVALSMAGLYNIYILYIIYIFIYIYIYVYTHIYNDYLLRFRNVV